MIKGIIFDYGGTIDTDALHWSEVLWMGYQHAAIPVSKKEFRTSYVFAERALATHPYIKPHHNFADLLAIKCDLETSDLVNRGVWHCTEADRKAQSQTVADFCFRYVLNILETARPILARLAEQYPLVLVSNFYGNIHTILNHFRLNHFRDVVESAVVGVRKPDPRIFQLGVDALRQATGLSSDELSTGDIVIVGDSYDKDILPAAQLGCRTIWLKGKGWDDNDTTDTAPLPYTPSCTIHHFAELPQALSHIDTFHS